MADDEHARHRHDHGQPGDQDRAPGGRGGRLQRGGVGAPRGALIALAPDVEHRVVHADREADQQHDGRDRLGDRDHVAHRTEQPDRRHDRGQPEQQRQSGGDERAERGDEDQQRDRQGQELGALCVFLERVKIASLALASPSSSIRSSGCAACACAMAASTGPMRSRAVVESPSTSNCTSDERRSRGDQIGGVRQRRADVGDEREALQTGLDVVERPLEARIVERDRPPALDEHLLAGVVRESGRDDLVGAAAFAAAEILVTLMRDTGGRASTTAAMTKASQPRIAVLRWPALQRPARAARLRWCGMALVPITVRAWTPTVALFGPPSIRSDYGTASGQTAGSFEMEAVPRTDGE